MRPRGKPFTGTPGPGRPKGSVNKSTKDIQAFARECLESPEYRDSLKRRLQRGDAPHMETLLHHYGYGKPKETVQVDGGLSLTWLNPS